MKSSIIVTLIGTLAATVNGIPIVDNANMAVVKSAQASATGTNVVYGLVHRRLNNIQSPGIKMPVSVIGMNSSLSGAPAPTEIKANGTFTDPFAIHMTEAVPATFDTYVSGTKGNMSDMPAQTSHIQASSPVSTMDALDYADQVQYWFTHCILPPVERRPKECATMKPSPVTESLPILEMTTLGTDASTTFTGQETELWMELTTIHSLMTPTPTPTDMGDIVVTVTSTVIQTEDPEIKYTFAKVDSASVMNLRG
ncbi:hypothetical protein CGRA01v4_04381 [Colletotrichum graminicola]|uniref:Uncharacterized protein n=1 Tax=Colletotrichum graminicola (strain M1.001 / M2 / FGSC 10212) TaxID=645133 RepID=E3Q9D6_COLGM|nr:uncharacterized protein GLRG_01810 [Colletotrichum graminicola M1.001]EFQ27315.1 hypothetical protein GLRG_01810 [Colletotrichum graminicola M1.001]WDK13100.1 hypothetical protein CGRA01v4_04381 [Colletotrichum graminicola]